MREFVVQWGGFNHGSKAITSSKNWEDQNLNGANGSHISKHQQISQYIGRDNRSKLL